MPTDWKTLENMERLISAIIASNGGKVSIFIPFPAASSVSLTHLHNRSTVKPSPATSTKPTMPLKTALASTRSKPRFLSLKPKPLVAWT